MDQADVRYLSREGDVEDGEPGAGVGHHPQHLVGGDVLDIERVETLALSETVPGQPRPYV